MKDERKSDPTEIETDPATRERVRVHKKFEESMDEKGLLEDDHSVRIEPEQVRHDQPPGTEQSAG
jgi:hypothetical protein